MIKPRVFGTKNITKFKNQVLILNNYILYAVFICQGKFLILGKISFNLKDAVKLRCLEAIKKHIKFKIKLKRHKENCHFTTQIFYFFILVNLILISALELWLLENQVPTCCAKIRIGQGISVISATRSIDIYV